MKNLVRRFFRNSTINFIRVPLGANSVSLPIAQLQGTKAGPAVFISAGVDGDEYAGIAAAYELIAEFRTKQFAGTLTIVPIVNMPGFEGGVSYNPMDNKYPKHVYPGKPTGSSTERLMYFLHTNYIRHANFWLNMHDGAISETLTPFVWTSLTGNPVVDNQTKQLLEYLPSEVCVFSKSNTFAAAQAASGLGAGYMMTESGQLGVVNKASVNRHLLWAHTLLTFLGMIGSGKLNKSQKKIYRTVHEYRVQKDGLWYVASGDSAILKGKTLGVTRTLGGDIQEKILARDMGTILWMNTGLRVSAGDIIAGVGSEEIHV